MNYAELIRNAVNEMQALTTKAQNEKRDLTEDELVIFKNHDENIQKWDAAQKREERIAEVQDNLKEPATTPETKPDVSVGKNREESKPWDNFGEFLGAVAKAGSENSVIDARLVGDVKNAATGMQVAVSSDGGFMVKQQFTQGLMDSVAQKSMVHNSITKIPIGGEFNGTSIPSLDETSRVNGSRWGGVQAYWATEAGTAAATKPKLTSRDLKLEKLLAFCYTTEELLRDGTALESFITRVYGDEIAFQLDDAVFNGTGVGKPLGILNSDSLISVAKESGQTADTVVWENIVKMWTRLASKYRPNAVWYINQEVESELMTMAQVVGTGGVPVYLPAGGASAAPYSTLMGRPVIPVEQLSALGDKGDILLAGMEDYVGIDKGGIEGDSSIHVQFLQDEQVFRFRYRFNGMPYTKTALTPYKGTQTISPYVAIAARA